MNKKFRLFVQPIAIVLCAAVLAVLAPLSVQAKELEELGELIHIVAADPDNLFSEMTSLMPGQSVDDYFVVENISKKNTTCDFFLSALLAGENDFDSANRAKLMADSEKLLNVLILTVTVYDAPNKAAIRDSGRVVYQGKADHSTQGNELTRGNRVKLGKLAPAQAVTIKISVTVPAELGNEYDGLQGKFWWKFDAEAEDPVPPPDSSSSRPESSSSSGPSSVASSSSTVPGTDTPTSDGGTSGGTVTPPATSGGRPPVSSSSTVGGVGDITASGGPTGNVFQDLIDGNIPIGGLNDFNCWSLINLICALLAFVVSMALIITLIISRRNELQEAEDNRIWDESNDEIDLEQDIENPNGNLDTEQQTITKKRLAILKIFAAIVGLFTGILFIILEDLRLPVHLINRWTPLIVAVFVLHVVLLAIQYVLKRKHKQDNDTPDENEEDLAPLAQ